MPERRARQFERFADTECRDDPLYVALCRLLARRPQALALLDAAAAAQQRPNLLLAAIHERVLAGAGGPLSAWFASVGGMRAPDAALDEAFDALFADQRSAIADLVATRSTQTNEIGRCAVLWPALAVLAARCGGKPLALLDFGCSAGLNLGVDRYAYGVEAVDGADRAPEADAPHTGVPRLSCHSVGGPGPPLPPPTIMARLGVDPAPVDVHDDAALRWLRACLWPHDRERAMRFDQAAALARRERWPVRQADDCAAAIEPWLDALPGELQPVVFNSWVLTYFDADALARHVRWMRSLVQRRGLAWLSAEGPWLQLGEPDQAGAAPAGDAQVSADELARATQWWLTLRGADGRAGSTLLARSHAHGRWVAWAT